MPHSRKVRSLAVVAGLAALSATTQLAHIGYLSPQWGMWIDVVAVSWIVAYLMFGARSGLIVSILGALVITLFAPETWLGALMKWTATIPVIGILWLNARLAHRDERWYSKWAHLVAPFAVALIARCVIVLPLNYLFAIPIWTGMSTQQALQVIPWYIIVLFNIIQTCIDVWIAWALVYRAKLQRFIPGRSTNVV